MTTTISVVTGKELRMCTPIAFVPEKGHGYGVACSSTGREEDSKFTYPLTAEDAKKCYEDIISRPEQHKHELSSPNINRQATRRKRSKRRCSTQLQSKEKDRLLSTRSTSGPSSDISVSQSFLYVQNNKLEELKSAAMSGHCWDVNVRDSFNWTLLMVASHAGHLTMVQYLLSQGARWKGLVDQRGRDAVDLARLGGHTPVVDAITTSGLDQEGEEFSCNATCVSTNGWGKKRSCKNVTTGKEDYSKRICPVYCKLCQMTVADDSIAVHDTSTVHLFSCQHHLHANTSYGIASNNRGYQMLLRSGWDPQKGLGPQQWGKMFPVKTVLKRDRQGFGLEETKSRVTHFSAHDEEAVKYRQRARKCSSKRKKDILQEHYKDRQWDMRMRAMLNEEDHGFA